DDCCRIACAVKDEHSALDYLVDHFGSLLIRICSGGFLCTPAPELSGMFSSNPWVCNHRSHLAVSMTNVRRGFSLGQVSGRCLDSLPLGKWRTRLRHRPHPLPLSGCPKSEHPLRRRLPSSKYRVKSVSWSGFVLALHPSGSSVDACCPHRFVRLFRLALRPSPL